MQFYLIQYSVPVKGKLTVSTRNSKLDPRSFRFLEARVSRLEFRVSSFELRASSFEFRVSSFQLPASSFRVSSLKFRDPKRILRQNDLFIEHRTVTENNCIFARFCTGLHCLSNQVGCECLIQSLFHLRLSFVCCRIWKCSAVLKISLRLNARYLHIVKNNTMVKVFCDTKLKLLEVKPQIRSLKSKEIKNLNVAVGFFGLCLQL